MTALATAPARPESQPISANLAYFVGLMFLFVFAQGLRVSGVPLPTALAASVIYIFAVRPDIPRRALLIYGAVIVYIALVSTRNALLPTGGLRDYLYLGICLFAFSLFICLRQIFENVNLKTIGRVCVAFAIAETVIVVLQYANPLDFNRLFAPMLSYYGGLLRSEQFMFDSYDRVPGTLGAPPLAGFLIYLLFKSASIALRKPWMVYFTLIPFLMVGSRTAFLIFVLWEMVVPLLFSRRHRAAVWAIAGVGGISVIGLIALFPQLFTTFFLFEIFRNPESLSENMSILGRLNSVGWALDNLDRFLTIGGVTAQEFAIREREIFGVDSELILRSLQFGLLGFFGLVAMNVWPVFPLRSRNAWFILAFVGIGALTNSLVSRFMAIPFILLYCLVVRYSETDERKATGETPEPQQDL